MMTSVRELLLLLAALPPEDMDKPIFIDTDSQQILQLVVEPVIDNEDQPQQVLGYVLLEKEPQQLKLPFDRA